MTPDGGDDRGAGALTRPFRVRPDLRRRVWGGRRLTPPGEAPVGEAWLAGPASVVAGGPLDGTTLDELALKYGAALVGSAAPRPGRFPLLVKILDPADWLSVQVHPDDEQAQRLAGPSGVGKTEAWFVISAEPGAEILLGPRPEATDAAVRAAIAGGGLAALLQRRRVAPGEAYLVLAGTLHAVGPGALLYEIQQPSDITYRCDDWGRPPSAERPLHVAESLVCVRPGPWTDGVRTLAEDGATTLVACNHFVLEGLRLGGGRPIARDPGAESVHVLTAVAGAARAAGGGWSEPLEPFDPLIVPADAGAYRIEATSGSDAIVLLGRLPTP